MSNLVQKSITDKNGVTSRRWVKADATTSATQKLPAPGVKKSKSSKRVKPSMLEDLHKRGPLGHTMITIDTFDPRAVQAVEDLLVARADGGGKRLDFHTSKAVKDALKTISDAIFEEKIDEEDESEFVYAPFNNIAVFGDVTFHSESDGIPDLPMLVGGLYQFPLITDYLLEADEDEIRKARALVYVASSLREPFTTTEYGEDRIMSAYDDDPSPFTDRTFLTSNDLSDFVMSRPDDAEEIVKTIRERGTTDVDALRDILDHGTQSLREGVL